MFFHELELEYLVAGLVIVGTAITDINLLSIASLKEFIILSGSKIFIDAF
jgi:hypothetical protein